jgi:glycosyltransferase involved in cell wall biosynthesis
MLQFTVLRGNGRHKKSNDCQTRPLGGLMSSALSAACSRPLVATSSSRAPGYIVQSAWHEHSPFLFWLMDTLRPRCFIELGTHFGYSYFTACQAVQELGLGTTCYAIDTWRGDEHAGFYGEEVFQCAQAHNQSQYSGFSQLIRATFDEALPYFPDGSVDLLHIDGRHFYDDVHHDFMCWRSKLTNVGIVMLHDTNVREHDFGVWKLFAELSHDHPAFEFKHGHGLGIIAPGSVPPALEPLFTADEQTTNFLRAIYAALGSAVSERWRRSVREDELQREKVGLQGEIGFRDSEMTMLLQQLSNRETEVATLHTAITTATAEANRVQAEHAKQVARYRRWLDDLRRDAASREAELTQHVADAEQKAARLAAEQQKLRTDYDRTLGSLSWRITSPVRRVFMRYPRALFALKRLARVTYWISTFRYARLAGALRERASIRREESLLRRSPLFDSEFYVRANPATTLSGHSPLRHYLARGRWEGRRPHPLFDGEWYLQQYPDVARSGANPLVHFVEIGIAENRNPNPFFDLSWYGRVNPDVSQSGLDPITHFMTIGAARFADPSLAFSTRWYLEQNPDVAKLSMNPLAHFLLIGQREGRLPRSSSVEAPSGRPAPAARIECRKLPTVRSEVALFVTHSPNGGLRPHVRRYLEVLAREGISIVLIVASDKGFVADEPWLYGLVDGLFIRSNEGFDFAAWAHVLRLHRELYRAKILYWLNDSVIGPVTSAAFHDVVERVRSTPADLVGLTDTYEQKWHIQSYFLALKRKALNCYALHSFVSSVVSLPDKVEVIDTYEVKLAQVLATAGLTVTSLFKSNSKNNPTTYHWRELLAEGFPFVKVGTIRDDIPGVDKRGWQKTLGSQGFDVELAERVVAGETDGVDRGGRARTDREDTLAPANPRKPHRMVFIGPWNFDNGLGVASRGYLSALMHSDVQTNFLPLERPFHIHQRATPTVRVRDFVGPADIAVVHLNPEAWDVLLTEEQRRIIDEAGIKIGAFIWESRKLPASFQERLPKVNAVWVPSRYCAEIFRAATDVPVQVVHFPIAARPRHIDPTEVQAIRRQLGLPARSRIILFALDVSSYLTRKNPSALVAAFRSSGLAASGWQLVLKMKLSSDNLAGTQALRQQVDDCPGASIIDRRMGSEAMAALMDAADIYASPHSSEGFGLTIAEAMAMGKVVVATDYGGSRDFLNDETGFPVRYSEWQLEQDEGPYLRGTVWAKVDEDHLAKSLTAAASLDEQAWQEVSERARRRVQDLLSPEAVAAEMRASIDNLCR